MDMKNYEFNLKTNFNEELIDISTNIERFVSESKIEEGIALIFVPHTTAGITINENADFDVKIDMLLGLKLAFPDRKEFRHFEGNSKAHIKATVVGNSETIIIESGNLKLGRWQGIFFCEFDGPRNRKVFVKIIGK
jgi:secondary thiamine-phosphate synthase enzyme